MSAKADETQSQLTLRPFSGGMILDCRHDDKLWKILHTQYTLVAIHRGGAEWRYRRRCITVGPGSVFVCEPGEVHETLRTHCPGDFTAFFCEPVAITDAAEASGINAAPHFETLGIQCKNTWQRLAALRRLLSDPDTEVLSEHVTSLLTDIVRHGEQRPKRDADVAPSELEEVRQTLLEEFLADPTRVISIQETARSLDIPYSTLVRGFSKRYSMAPYQMVSAFRARFALNRLQQGPTEGCQTIAALAAECGYADNAHMTRAFRQHWGLTPRSAAKALNPAWLASAASRSRRRA